MKGLKKKNVAIFLFIGILCLMATMMVPMRSKPGTDAVLELDMVEPATAEAFFQPHVNTHRSLVETVNDTGLNEFLVENMNWTEPKTEPEKYLVYLCDGTVRCYGLADRERGITLAYLLSVLTNRKFGMISTSPVPLADYYVPNKIDWSLNPKELQGKTSIELSLLGTRQKIGLSSHNFNKKYPQDVVYLRTNRDIGSINLIKNLNYRFRFLNWTLKTKRKLFAKIWVALMKPSHLLRRQLNTILAEIALTMKQEALLHTSLKTPPCQHSCELLETNRNVWDQSEFKSLNNNAELCMNTLQNAVKKAPSTILKGENQETMLSLLKFKDENEEEDSEEEEPSEGDVDSITVLQDLCKTTPAISPNVSIDDIWASQGYDYLDLNLVCVHIRLGNSPTMPFEKGVRNTLEDCDGVWKFLEPYVEKGHHVFLASDAEQVRIKGKSIFGSKIHINEAPVIHIDKVKDWQDERKGMELALTEQLLLMTSCHTLVVSNSGFSQRAAMIRRQLLGIGNVYLFRKAAVLPWAIHF